MPPQEQARPDTRLKGYVVALLLVAIAVAARLVSDPLLGERSPFLFFTLAVLVAGGRYGPGPGLLATLASALVGTFNFLPPRFAFGPLTSDTTSNLAAFVITSIGIVVIAHQLRRSRREEARSRAARASLEERERRLIDAVQDYAILELDADGRILTWNSGAERMKGWSADEAIGEHLAMLHTPEQRKAGHVERELEIARATGRYEEEGDRLRKDGSHFCAHVALFALRDGDGGQVTGFVKVTRDITERRETEARIRELNETLEGQVAERTRELKELVEELDAFTYTVSHDLRAPLRAMEGFGRILLDEHVEQLDEQGRRYAVRIVGAAERMERLIDDLLAYSRLTRTELQPYLIDPSRAIERCAKEIGAARAAEFEVAADLPRLRAEPAVLEQVLCNLISNAVKFHPPGVTPRVRIWGERSDGAARLWVEDEGIGVAPEHSERIFRIFERLHGQEAYPGTGVGLAIVRKAVERMGGSCGVEPAPGGGSRFWIELPDLVEGR